MQESTSNYHDVVIIGAGLSGIGAACHLQTEVPDIDFVILEAVSYTHLTLPTNREV